MRAIAAFLLGVVIAIVITSLQGCATAPPQARVIEWAPVADVALTCAAPHGERVVMMHGGCVVVWNEAQASIVTSAKDTSYSDLGAMLRYAIKGQR